MRSGRSSAAALTDSIGWRWIFFLNLPIAVFAMFITFRVVGKDQPDRAGQRIDYAGIAALSVGILSLLLALDEGADRGWTNPLILGLFAFGAVALVGFAFIERRAGETRAGAGRRARATASSPRPASRR